MLMISFFRTDLLLDYENNFFHIEINLKLFSIRKELSGQISTFNALIFKRGNVFSLIQKVSLFFEVAGKYFGKALKCQVGFHSIFSECETAFHCKTFEKLNNTYLKVFAKTTQIADN